MSLLWVSLLLGCGHRAPPEDLCTGGWCWTWPEQTGATLTHVVARSADEAVVLAQGGLVLSWDGRFRVLHEGDVPLHALTLAPDGQVWVAGEGGVVRRFDGESWHDVDAGTDAQLNDLWVGDDTWWAAGEKGRKGVLVTPGEITEVDHQMYSVTMTADGPVFGGQIGHALRPSAEGDEPELSFVLPQGMTIEMLPPNMRPPEPAPWVELWDWEPTLPSWDGATSDGSGTVWLMGNNVLDDIYEVRRRVDGVWETLPVDGAEGLRGMTGGERPWVVGLGPRATPGVWRFDGTAFVPVDAVERRGMVTYLHDVATADGATWVVGENGLLLRDRGEGFERLSGTDISQDIEGLGGEAFRAAPHDGEVLAWSKKRGWAPVTEVHTPTATGPVAMDPTGGVWIGASDGLRRFDGEAWTTWPGDRATRLVAPAPDRAYAVVNGQLRRFTGSAWELEAGPSGVRELWATGEAMLVGGADFLAWRSSPEAEWEVIEVTTGRHGPGALAATGRDDIWFTAGGELHHHDGQTTEVVAVPEAMKAGRHLRALRAAPGEVWVTGSDGLVLRYAQGTWTDLSVVGACYLYGLTLTDEEVWVYGRNAILRRTR